MTSDSPQHTTAAEAFVWIWLPGELQPVIAGRIALEGGIYSFNYGRSYLERPKAIAIYAPECSPGEERLRPMPRLK